MFQAKAQNPLLGKKLTKTLSLSPNMSLNTCILCSSLTEVPSKGFSFSNQKGEYTETDTKLEATYVHPAADRDGPFHSDRVFF